MNTCDYIIETLYLNGIDTYFVITGGAIVPFINAIAQNPKVKYYCFQNEQSAAMILSLHFLSVVKSTRKKIYPTSNLNLDKQGFKKCL